ncbi:MAG: GGDEF domain-containing protein [Candidatus Dormiibacterota bacterium]
MDARRDASPRMSEDTLIFQISPGGLSLVGGSGRGAGWSGIVDLTFEDEPLATRVHGSSRPARVDGAREPVRVIGPYWARHAALVPVGGEHLVVFGGDEPLPDPDAVLVPAAAHLVAAVQKVSPAKLLADELEVVHAIRDLVEYRPELVVETARHIAGKAAEPLSCEVGAVLLHYNGTLVAEVVTRNWSQQLDVAAIRGTLITLFERAEQGAFVELELEPSAGDALGRDQGLVARFAVPIGRPKPFGVLVVAHAATRARGFTNLCQRIGYSLADVAESLLVQAMSREELAADRDRFALQARIDPLTGLENRAAWDEHVAAEEARRGRYARSVTIVSADLDNLKAVNDRYGHEAGDRLIRAAANLLRRHARGSDRIARVGGDEFLILMPETDDHGAGRYLSRVRAANRRIQATEVSALQLSFGAATAREGESLATVTGRADAAMYAAKKRHFRRSLEASGA